MPATATAAPKHAAAAPRSATVSHAPAKAAPVAKHDIAPAAPCTNAPVLPPFARPAVAALHPVASPETAPKLIHMPAQTHATTVVHAPASNKPATPTLITPKAATPLHVEHKPATPKPVAPVRAETHAAANKPNLAPLAPAKTSSLGSGQPLAPHIQAAIQNSLMVDLSSVCLHASTAAERQAQSLSARAFTFGNDIFLGHGARRSMHFDNQQRTQSCGRTFLRYAYWRLLSNDSESYRLGALLRSCRQQNYRTCARLRLGQTVALGSARL